MNTNLIKHNSKIIRWKGADAFWNFWHWKATSQHANNTMKAKANRMNTEEYRRISFLEPTDCLCNILLYFQWYNVCCLSCIYCTQMSFFSLSFSLSPTIYRHALSSKRTNVLCYVTNSQLYWCWCVWLFLVWQFLPVIGLLNQNDRNRKEWVWKGASCVWCASVCQCLYPPSQKHAFMF